MVKQKEQFEKPERERKREMYRQGDVVFAKHLSLWSTGTFVQYNKDGTLRVRLGNNGVNLKFYEVAQSGRP